MDSELDTFEKLKAAGELPSPRGVALTIVRLAQREDVGVKDIERAIKADPAFVGRLVKTANITARGSGRPVISVPDAIRVLGINVVRNLALGFSLISGYRAGACRSFDYSAFWSRAIVTALALQAIVRRTRWANPEEAFCCGLLADIGRLALATVHATDYSKLLDELRTAGLLGNDYEAALLAQESELFLLDHDALTAAMLADWGFPQSLIEPIRFHRQPERASFVPDSRGERLLAAVRLASAIADVCLVPPAQRPAATARLAERSARVHIDREALEALVDQTIGDWRDWAPLLSLDSPPALPPFGEILAPIVDNAPPLAEPLAQRSLRVLIASADEETRATLARLLAGIGQQVVVVADGETALERALELQPQLIIADWQLPAIDGLNLTRILRNTRIGRGTYILILSTFVAEDRLVDIFDAGADDYLQRPVNERAFLARFRAGARIIGLHDEVRRDHEELQQIAAELAVSNRRLHEASVTDELTGFNNRRYALERLDRDWSASSRSGRPLSCMMIDLDDFKQVNDRYGHSVGDQALVAIAGVLRRALRANDVICRLGGDEFLVISTDTDAAAIAVCADRLRAAIGALSVDSGRGMLRFTLSIGVATRSADVVDAAMLVRLADEDMYQSKPGGRAR